MNDLICFFYLIPIRLSPHALKFQTFVVNLYIDSKALRVPGWRHGSCNAANISKVLGAWFNVFPFSLSELCGPIRAKDNEKPATTAYGRDRVEPIKVPPFVLKGPEHVLAYEKIAAEMKNAVVEHNENMKTNMAKLSLNSSSGSDLVGGVCFSELGLDGILKRYCREMFPEDAHSASSCLSCDSANRPWIERDAGRCSAHRQMRQSGTPLISSWGEATKNTYFHSYLGEEDRVLAHSNLRADCTFIHDSTRSLKGVLDHLENLHHPSVPFVDGLTVELLEFQRQSVQWALERETTPGGVQSFLWAKLPSVAEPGHDLYFNPILERFSKDKPRLARGGIIAEEMGLGKTVISLALILQNPAPVAPLSGSPVTVLGAVGTGNDAISDGPTSWDKELYSRTSVSNSKRGSIISRGTLVVVSDDSS